ncbi:MAG: NAD(P)H-dependent oxidoreductase [Desulfomonilaceae bacterium]|nr:NAD(P)H-dependent oxidoreductase [Desulfomonilaceae bacterium]
MKRLSSVRQIFLYVAPFPALAFFKVWASLGTSPGVLFLTACLLFVYCVGVVVLAWHWDKPTYFDWAVTLYFLALVLLLGFWPKASAPILTQYAVTGIYLCLFLTALVPPLIGLEPFTNHYAKKYVPGPIWSTQPFISINRTMTFAWAGLFAVCVVLSLYPSVITRAIVPLSLILGVGMPFNMWFPDHYLKRIGLPSMAQMQKFAKQSARNAGPSTSPAAVVSTDVTAPEAPNPAPVVEFAQGPINPTTFAQPERRAEMKIIAINSSARGEGTSKTRIMLDALVNGMVEAGASVETVHLRDKKIKYCIGCFTCWTKTPGICVQKDDMTNEIFPKWMDADIAVYATPLYHYTVNAEMKAFIERTLPIVEPFMVRRDGRTHHPLRKPFPKSVFLSVAGFPEASVFDQLSSYVNSVFGNDVMAEIYRPSAEAMVQPEFRNAMNDILDATTQAGRELVQSMKVSGTTMERITQSFGDFDWQAKMANAFWKTCIAEQVTPREFVQKGMMPRPDSIDTFLMIMSIGFNSKGAAGTAAVLQFNFSGEVDGICHLIIDNGTIEGKEGASEKPDLIVESPFDVWMDIITGKTDGREMFMQQRYKTSGDLSLLLRMNDMFGKRDS